MCSHSNYTYKEIHKNNAGRVNAFPHIPSFTPSLLIFLLFPSPTSLPPLSPLFPSSAILSPSFTPPLLHFSHPSFSFFPSFLWLFLQLLGLPLLRLLLWQLPGALAADRTLGSTALAAKVSLRVQIMLLVWGRLNPQYNFCKF